MESFVRPIMAKIAKPLVLLELLSCIKGAIVDPFLCQLIENIQNDQIGHRFVAYFPVLWSTLCMAN